MPNSTQQQHTILLGIDYGSKRLGLAIGQAITQSARPLKIIHIKKGKTPWQDIINTIKEWGVDGIIVGMPINMDGSKQPIGLEVQSFIQQLRQHTTLPIYSVDERLTTVEAKQQMSMQKKPHHLESSYVDSYAAKIILESWFSEHRP